MNKIRISTKIQKCKKRIKELKNLINELKISLERYRIKLDQTEETIKELKNKLSEIIQSEEQKEKRIKRNKENLKDLCNTIKRMNIYIMEVPEGKREKKRQKAYLKKQWSNTSQICGSNGHNRLKYKEFK